MGHHTPSVVVEAVLGHDELIRRLVAKWHDQRVTIEWLRAGGDRGVVARPPYLSLAANRGTDEDREEGAKKGEGEGSTHGRRG
jgi:hypothetical protein